MSDDIQAKKKIKAEQMNREYRVGEEGEEG